MTCSSLSADQGGSDHLSIGKHHLQGLCLNSNRLQSSFLQFYKKKDKTIDDLVQTLVMRFKLLIQRLRFLPTVTRTRPDTLYIHYIGDHDYHDQDIEWKSLVIGW